MSVGLMEQVVSETDENALLLAAGLVVAMPIRLRRRVKVLRQAVLILRSDIQSSKDEDRVLVE